MVTFGSLRGLSRNGGSGLNVVPFDGRKCERHGECRELEIRFQIILARRASEGNPRTSSDHRTPSLARRASITWVK